tara:strand:+ start:282 stop:821 length:540 start_codon:yes stop_codon:yes gene_type:complete
MTFHFTENSKFSLKSIVSDKLTNKEIKKICVLKDTIWIFGIKSQINWFNNNIKKYDIHNLFFIKSKLIGYTLLRKRTCEIKNLNKKTQYLLFDTLIIDKKYRNMKLSNLLMNFNNMVIKQSNYFSFLMCKKGLLNFYKKNKWATIDNKNINIKDHPFSTYGMLFNNINKRNKYNFYIHK